MKLYIVYARRSYRKISGQLFFLRICKNKCFNISLVNIVSLPIFIHKQNATPDAKERTDNIARLF